MFTSLRMYVLTNLPPLVFVRVWRGVASRWSEEERRQFLIFVTAQSALPSDHLKARNGHYEYCCRLRIVSFG